MSKIVLSAGVRQNLLSLQKTAELMAITQGRLATGKKVNSALDNPTNFFTSAALQSRAGDLNSLLDSMSVGIKTLEAADNGVTAITRTIEGMQSTLRQARQDKSFKTESYAMNLPVPPTGTETLSFGGGSVGSTAVNVNLTTTGTGAPATPATLTGAGGADLSVADPDLSALTGQSVTITQGANTVTYNFTGSATGQKAALLADLNAQGFTVAATADGLDISRADGENFTVTTSNAAVATAIGIANNTTSTDGVPAGAGPVVAKTVDALVAEINSNPALQGKIRASNDSGKLRIENQATGELTIAGVASGAIDGSLSTTTIDGNEVRKNLVVQFNELRDQLDKLSDDASFNGINLLRGDLLKITFNETGTSTIEIQARDLDGNQVSINAARLNIFSITDEQMDADASIDGLLLNLSDALNTIRSHASNFGSNLSIVQNRTEFTKAMINTLATGADSLVLADTNEEAANMLALQTRQQLSSTALSLASQADQAVLRLFG